jgi:hypothetical protein
MVEIKNVRSDRSSSFLLCHWWKGVVETDFFSLKPVAASVAIVVSRQTSVQPLEETVTISTDQEFQEFLENEDSFLFDETNKKVVHFMSLRNNRHYHLEQKPGKASSSVSS